MNAINKLKKTLQEMDSMPEREEKEEHNQPVKRKRIGKKQGFGFDMHRELIRIIGVDVTAIPGINVQTASRVISETCIDMSKWQTSKQFAAWLGLCPGNKVSGGKRLSGKTAPSQNKAAAALRTAAISLRLTDTALGAFFRRMCIRLGTAKAITAAAHKLALILYNMIKTCVEYVESGAQYYEELHRERTLRNLEKKAEKFGLTLVPMEQTGT